MADPDQSGPAGALHDEADGAADDLQLSLWSLPFAPDLISLVSLREDVHIETGREGETVIYSRWEEVTLPPATSEVLDALHRMSLGPILLGNVLSEQTQVTELRRLLAGLEHLVVRSIAVDPGQPAISVTPLTQQAHFVLPAGLQNPVRLSRFTTIRTDGTGIVMESPLALHRVVVHTPEVMAALSRLMRPLAPHDMDADLTTYAAYLVAAGLAVEATASPVLSPVRFAEDEDPALAGWNPDDLMFHTRSTMGRHDNDFGALYRMGEQAGVEPVVKAVGPGRVIQLPRPAWDDLVAADPPLTVAVEGARRNKAFADSGLTLEALAHLLYRVARIRALVDDPDPGSTTGGSDRPYLVSGHRYGLEIYLAVDRCADLASGVYRYDPYGHRLETVTPSLAQAHDWLDAAAVDAGLDGIPPVLLAVSARFRRLSWKFEGPSYAFVLKDAGSLLQALAIVGSALGLSACEVPPGNIDSSARILGLDWRVESVVAGLAVGRPAPASGAHRDWHDVNDADWAQRARIALQAGKH